MDSGLIRSLEARRERESGTGVQLAHAPLMMALLYPSPYSAAMSSLGYLQIHRRANLRPETRCERAVLPDADQIDIHRRTRTPLLTLESQRPLDDFHVIGISHAYELELAGLATCFDLAGIPPLAIDRHADHPLVVVGGPITFSNPLPTAAFADVVLMGEAEGTLEILLAMLEKDPARARGDRRKREALLEELAGLEGFYVPTLHGERLPPVGMAPDHLLPAVSAIHTPDTELHSMVLIEPERGCHRGCTFCVMRRSTNGGMRLVSPERVLSLIPDHVPRVGLVGAAVSDHPQIKDILRGLIDGQGKHVGISSLRADRLDDEFVGLLARGGYKSMTVALDAASARLRIEIEKNLRDRHIFAAAELARAHGMKHLKVYVIVGLPDESDEDIDELIGFALALRKILPVKLGVSPFVPKLRTPLAGAPFCGEKTAAHKLDRLRKGLAGKVEVRGPSARESYVEYRLAQGGLEHARAAIAAAEGGGTLAAWKKALVDLPDRASLPNMVELTPPSSRERRRAVLSVHAS